MDKRWSRLVWGAEPRITGIRLAAEIALAPLPVFMWIQSHGWYARSSRHPAEALYTCAHEALISTFACGGIGLMIGLLCGRNLVERLGIAFMVSATTFLVWTYLDVNAVAYA